MNRIDRYLIREFLNVFLPFLIGLYFLFALLDYSTHIQEFLKSSELTLSKLGLYYFFLFSKELHILLPFALLIALLKSLSRLNINRELTALLSSGISIRRLLLPFFYLSALLSLLLILNYQCIHPKAFQYFESFQKLGSTPSHKKKNQKGEVRSIALEDLSHLLFFDRKTPIQTDVYWVKSVNEIWHFSSVDLEKQLGYYGDSLVRNREGVFEKIDSQNQVSLPKISKKSLSEEKTSSNTAFLTYKITSLLFPFIVLMGVLPSLIVYRRQFRLFFLYALSIFGFIAFFTIMENSIILAESGRISPFWAISFFPLLLLTYLSMRLKNAT
ncbi:MAG: LptF/LptG family permease [Simkaniaceae bacterium]